ncbi:MAG: M48 family metallopeptidase [Cytophagaceae bacterium]|nr:M48 family metallopeptidase [Cytophagaceae bacterium]
MNSDIILIIIIGILSFDFALDQILDYINLKNQKPDLPTELHGIYDEEKYKKSHDYHLTNTKFGFLTATFSFVLILLVIITGAFGWLNGVLTEKISSPIIVSLTFFGIIFIISDILNIPFSLYKIFVIEEKFGFNKTTVKTYITDKIKGYLLTIIFGGIILGSLLFLIDKLEKDFWLWFWMVISAILVFINVFYTSLIVPLFNKLKPLEDGELRQSIEAYSKKVDFPLTNIFVIDGSKRSTKANAYFSGIGSKKKIVLFDTLINNHTKEELIAVLAHEVGHYKKKHIQTGLLLSILQIGVILFISSLFLFNSDLSKALGAETNTIHLNLIAFGILFTPISHVIGIFMNIFSRKNEYEADKFAAVTYQGQPLQDALKKLSVNNLSNLTPHPAYVFIHYSHPPLLARLKALQQIKL